MQTVRSFSQVKYLIVMFAGAFFALCVWKIMALEVRYAAAIAGGILVVSAGMMAIYRIEDFLVYALIFNIPFARFGKWLFPQEEYVAAQGIMLGLAEMLILVAYIAWFAQIFIVKRRELPRIKKTDFFIVLLLAVSLLSLLRAPNKTLGFFDVIYNVKHAMLYFFIAHKVQRRHLKPIIAIFLFAIMFESSLAMYERVTGNVGIGISKGKTSVMGQQQSVPGIETELRSGGTTNDPHTLGLYFAMILPIPFVFVAINFMKRSVRFLLFCILVAGALGLIFTFARAGWLGFALSSAFAVCVIVFSWKQGRGFLIVIAVVITVSILYPKGFEIIYNRFANSPPELLEDRFEMNWTAVDIWRKNPILGCGAANYMEAVKEPDIKIFGRDDTAVHNAYLRLAAETGLVGVISFYAIIVLAMYSCWKMLKCEDLLIRGLALALLGGFFSYMLDGLSSPMFKSSVPYALLWTYIGLSVALKRLSGETIQSDPGNSSG